MNTTVINIFIEILSKLNTVIITLSSELFYDGRLMNGISPHDRSCLISGLPPIAAIDNRGEVNIRSYLPNNCKLSFLAVCHSSISLHSIFFSEEIDIIPSLEE